MSPSRYSSPSTGVTLSSRLQGGVACALQCLAGLFLTSLPVRSQSDNRTVTVLRAILSAEGNRRIESALARVADFAGNQIDQEYTNSAGSPSSIFANKIIRLSFGTSTMTFSSTAPDPPPNAPNRFARKSRRDSRRPLLTPCLLRTESVASTVGLPAPTGSQASAFGRLLRARQLVVSRFFSRFPAPAPT